MSWTQKGQDIDGENSGDLSGYSVSLNSNGTIVAIGAPYNGSNSGHVRVYEWDESSSSWTQKGQDIDGENSGDYSGNFISLNSDGTIVAIGSRFNDGNGNNSGHVRVYEWDESSSSWTQKGQDIDGESINDLSGHSVSLNSDGTIVAIGAIRNDGNGSDSGHVRVYKWNNTTSSWIQKGQDIDGENSGDYSGTFISLNSDGTIVAIGSTLNDGNGSSSGHVRVYEWNQATSSWTQKGQDIDGENSGDYSGHSVSLNSDGTIVAIGAPYNDNNGNSSGHVRVYTLTNNRIINVKYIGTYISTSTT